MSKAAAFLAGMGAGYLDAKRRGAEDERQKKRDDQDQQRFDADMADRKARSDAAAQDASDKAAVRKAAAPQVAEPIAGPVPEGQAVPEGQNGLGYTVGAKHFAERGVADAAATASNTPEATRTRVAEALSSQGRVVEADQLATSGLQAKAAKITITKAERDEANAVYDDGIKAAIATGDPRAIAKFMSDTHADGKGGASKFEAQVGPDGSWEIMAVGPDGSLQPTSAGKFGAGPDEMIRAGYLLSKSTSPDAKVAHALQVKEAERRKLHDEKSLAIQKQQADTAEQARKDRAANDARQAANEAQRIANESKRISALEAKASAPGAPIQLSLKDMRDFESDLSGYIKDQFPLKEGADAKERSAMQAEATQKRSLASTIFERNAAAGTPLTAGTVMQAMDLAADRKNVRIAKDAEGNPHEVVVVNGKMVLLPTGGLKPRAAAPQPAAAAAPKPAAVVRAASGVAPVAQPAAPQPAAIPPEHAAALAPLAANAKQLFAQMAAVSKSGDAASINALAPKVNAAQAALAQEAQRRLGPQGAEQFLQSFSR